MLDLHLQYALHTTSFAEQPISDKTLSRFRKRCYDYETIHGVDLYRDCVKDLGNKIAKMMKLNGRIRRMDSIMIESNIRFLSRMELIYTCISKLVVYLIKNHSEKIPVQLERYADPNDYNRLFYHQRNDDMEQIIQMLLMDSDCLLELCKSDFEEATEYQLFARCLSDQTVVENEKRRLRTKEDGTMNSSALQNPSDPDATYRNKSGKLYRGYAANIEETVGKNGSVVTDYQFDKNTHTDSHFLQESLSAMEKSEEEIILVTDGGYDGQDNIALAKEKNVKLVTTALIGKEAPDALADFEFNEDGEVEYCSSLLLDEEEEALELIPQLDIYKVDYKINIKDKKVILLTGRNELDRADTIDWLRQVIIERTNEDTYRRINFQLICRPSKYDKSNAIFKKEKVLELTKQYHIQLIIEDHPKIIEEYTKLGFLVLKPNRETKEIL